MKEKYKILLVEDNKIVQKAFAGLVKQKNLSYDYVVAGSVAETKQALIDNQFDVALLDYLLDDGTAFDLFADMGDTPIIIVTGSGDEATAVEAMKAGALDYVIKDPAGNYLTTLPAIIERVISRHHAKQELKIYREQLEGLVAARTSELAQANEQLVAEIAERKRVEEEIKHRNRELGLLNRVIAASAASLESNTILEITCCELAQAFKLPHVSAVLINETETTATVVAECRDEDQPVALGITAPLLNNPPMQYLLAHKTPLIMDEAQTHPDLAVFHNQLRQGNIVSLVILPLIVEQRIIGCLNLYIDEASTLSTEDVSLAWSVAEQVSGALARAQLNKAHQQLAEQLRQSQKMEAIGRLAGGMAHDFNNLLTVITGYSELLLHRHVSKDSPQYKDIKQIHKAGERAAALTRQLLAFSRQQMIQPIVLDLNAIIRDTHEMLRRLVSEDIDLSTTLDPVLGRIKADPGQIEQIILNLVVNACDAMPQGGKLTIKTANIDPDKAYASQHLGLEPGPYVLLTISDTGIGMDEETQSHIFEPFFTTKETGKGTGLGLATVYGIVRQNKGYISATSQPEQGTTFHVYLPRLDPTPARISRDQKPAGTIQGTETILLVEDEDMVRQLAYSALLGDGYHVLEADQGQEALRVSEQYNGPIHLLLTDIVMPGGLGGRELAERLTSLRPETKVLYMSGYTNDSIIRVLDTDVTFLQKPFSPSVLSRKVREVLDKPKRK